MKVVHSVQIEAETRMLLEKFCAERDVSMASVTQVALDEFLKLAATGKTKPAK